MPHEIGVPILIPQRNARVFLTKRVNEDGDCYLLGFSPKLWLRVVAEVSGQQGEGVKGFYLDDARELEISAGRHDCNPQAVAGLRTIQAVRHVARNAVRR